MSTNHNQKLKVAFLTLGCKVNQFETDAMYDLFKKHPEKYEFVEFSDCADIYIVNTCTVTNVGDKKSRQIIRRGKKNNPNAIVIVAGCYAQVSPDEVKNIEGVNIVIGTKYKSKIVEIVESYDRERDGILVKVEDMSQFDEFEELKVDFVKEKTRAFIKVQDGCNQFCSYCIIPYARGRVRSREPENVLKEVTELVANGHKEFVITGIHVTSYEADSKVSVKDTVSLQTDFSQSNDQNSKTDLIGLLKQIEAIEGVERIRLGSMEPVYLTEENIIELSKNKKVCSHFHLSLQSGSDTVLQRMNRKYLTSDYQEVVNLLRKHFDNPAITTDIIVGFPGETDIEFNETKDFVKTIGFSEVHAFPYSVRSGTKAEKMENHIDPQIKKRRMDELKLEIDQCYNEFRESLVGTQGSVLIEQSKVGKLKGYLDNYIEVELEDSDEKEAILVGHLYDVLVTGYKDEKLLCKILKS